MKINPWTLGLAAAGVVSLASAVQAEEATESVKTMLSSTTISGYVNTSVHWNPSSAPGTGAFRTYGGGIGNTKDDGFNLDVVSLTIEKPMDEGEWSAGYRAQLWFGPDANFFGGLGTTSTTGFAPSDFAVKNAYVSLRAPVGNGIDVKLGVFDTIVGYEATDVPANPNYTRSWGFSLEPKQHTGVLASYRFNDMIAASAGVANTATPTINGRVASSQSQKTYMGALTFTAPDSFGPLTGASLTAGAVDGRGVGAAAGPDATLIYVGATLPTGLEGLNVGLAWDHLNIDTLNDADSIAGYLSYQATEKLRLNLRGDYFDDGAGAFFGAGSAAKLAGKPAAIGAEVISVTATVDYALWENVISRLEYRWDHDLSNGQHFPGTTAAAGRNNANLLALNVIYKF